MAEIPREGQAAPARIFLVLRLEQFPGAVARTVVHADDFVIQTPRRSHRIKPLKKFRQHGFFVEARDDDGDFVHAGRSGVWIK